MRKLVFAGVIAGASALAGAAPASAAVFDLSFSGTGISGTLSLSLGNGSSPYSVDGASGSVDIGGTTYAVTGLATYAGDNQTAYYPSGSTGYVNFQGISVETTDGALNLFSFSPTSYGVVLASDNPTGDPASGPYYAVTVTDSPPVPEMSTWAMLGLGFAGLAMVATRKRKTPLAALG